MALVIKYQHGGTAVLNTRPKLVRMYGHKVIDTDALNFLQSEENRNHYSLRYSEDTQEQFNQFNDALDKYIEAFQRGEMDFFGNGLHRKDGKPVEGVSPEMDHKILDFIKAGLFNLTLPTYNESYKPKYGVNLSKILAYHQFNNENLNDFTLAWETLDPKDPNTGLRGVANRKAAYVKALRAEAKRLRTDSKYRKKWQFNGWEDNINAYEDIALQLEQHANSIEGLPDVTKEDESWFQSAILAGLSPDTVVKFFNKETATSRAIATRKQEELDKLNTLLQAELEANKLKGLLFNDPLSVKDTVWYDPNDGKEYTINDSWLNLPNETALLVAQQQLSFYGRQQIKLNWGYWNKYSGYLENLTSLFSAPQNGLRIYALSKGALGNVGKRFFIRNDRDLEPTEVTIFQNSDGTYSAKAGDKTYSLGTYDATKYTSSLRLLDAIEDLGKPFLFDIHSVFASMLATNDYWNSELLRMHPNDVPTTLFWDMLYKLSNLYSKLPESVQRGQHTYRGSTFIKGDNVFIWRFRGHQITFVFNGKIRTTVVNGLSVFNPLNLHHIEIGPVLYKKEGGAIAFLLTGGDLVKYQERIGTANNVVVVNSEPTRQAELQQLEGPKISLAPSSKNNPESYGAKLPESPFTGADAVRLGASLLDLAGSFMIFPKGLNIASAAVSGTAFLGYIGADIYDVIDGKADLWPTLWNDIKMAGVMAFPMFMNPAKMKAWGAGDRMQKLASQISKWYGTAVTVGFLMDPEMQKSIKGTIDKIGHARFSDFNALDLSNIAFILRSIGGSRELYRNIKHGRAGKKAEKDAQTGVVQYRIKTTDAEGKVTYSDPAPMVVDRTTDISKKNIVQQIVEKKNAELKELFEKKNAKPEAKTEAKPEETKSGEGTAEEVKSETTETPPQITADQVEILTPVLSRFKKTSNLAKGEDDRPLDIKWETPKEFQSLEYEEWYPNRIWQKATRNGETISRENTAFGNWVRKTLKFEDDFDVFFSDYSLVKSSRLGKIERISKALYGGIEDLRALAKEFSDIFKKLANGELSKAEALGAILTKMEEYGFNRVINSRESLMNKARELAELYDGTLSKFDNLQVAQMLYDLDNPETSFGKLKEKAPVEETKEVKEGETPSEEPTPKATTVNELASERLYNDRTTITPEELLEAYIKFKEVFDKQLQQENSAIKQVSNFNRKELVGKVFSTFNKESATELRKMTVEQLAKLIGNTKAFKDWKSKAKNLLIPKDVVDKIVAELGKKQNLDNRSILAVRQVLNKSTFANGSIKDKVNTALFGELKPLDLGELQQIIRNIPAFKTWIKRSTNPTALPTSVHNNIYNTILSKYNYASKDMETIGNLLNGTLDSGLFLADLIAGRTYKTGGTLSFVRRILKALTGTPIGGISLSDPNSTWFDRYGKYVDYKAILKYTLDYLSSDKTRYLFDKNNPNSIYLMLKLKSELELEYNTGYKDKNLAIYDDKVQRFQNWVHYYFPQLIGAANLASEDGAYLRNGLKHVTDYDLNNYTGDSKYAAITNDWNLFGDEAYRTSSAGQALLKTFFDALSAKATELGYTLLSSDDGTPGFNFYLEGYTTPEGEVDGEAGGDGSIIEGSGGSSSGDGSGSGSGSGDGSGPKGSKSDSVINPETYEYELPEFKLSKPQITPRENLNWEKIAYTLGMNALNWDIRNTYKKVPYRQKSYNTFGRVYGDDTQINNTRRLYGQFLSGQHGQSSDLRVNIAAILSILSKYHTADAEAHKVDIAKREATWKEAGEKAEKNLLNATNTYNENLKSSVAEEKEAQEQTAATKLMNANNIKNYFESMFTERDTFNRARLHYYLDDKREFLNKELSDEIEKINKAYFDLYKDLEGRDPNSTYENFMTDPAFVNHPMSVKYKQAIDEITARRNASYNALLDALFNWQGYGGSPTWRYYKDRDMNEESQKALEDALKKQKGGKIHMAKSGGASVNWVKVENARMANRAINTVIKETYRTLRTANRELQKNIRAMEPLIRQLNKRDTVKLK